jgi:hypothetical protein
MLNLAAPARRYVMPKVGELQTRGFVSESSWVNNFGLNIARDLLHSRMYSYC